MNTDVWNSGRVVVGVVAMAAVIAVTVLAGCGKKQDGADRPAPDAAAQAVKQDGDVPDAAETAAAIDTAAGASTFTDPRDNQTYRTVKIGSLTWMAENLNHKTGNSWCYEDDESNCEKYGRLYDWKTAMAACPEGWRLPTQQDWNDLVRIAGGDVAGTKLRSRIGWNDFGNNGTDDFGFSALPGGYHNVNGGGFYDAGEQGNWWEDGGGDGSDYRYMYWKDDIVTNTWDSEERGFSVRCSRD